MHLHAKDAQDPPGRLCLPVTVYGVIDPACSEPLLAPLTNEQMVERTVRTLKTRNIFGVISCYTLETVRRFQKAAPDRLIPAYQLNLGHDSYLSPEALRRHVKAGDLGRAGRNRESGPAGIAPDDKRMEPYWQLAEELDIPYLALHVGEGYPGVPYLGSPNYRVRLGSPLLLEEVLI